MKIITETFQKISTDIFNKYPDQIVEIANGQPGVYALYKGDHLYYVGKAIDLRRRLEQHLKDQHQGRWNNFSLFITKKKEYISIIETILINVANPPGNKSRFANKVRHGQRKLYRMIQRQHKLDMATMFKKEERLSRATSRKSSHFTAGHKRPPFQAFKGYFNSPRPLKAEWQGTTYHATLFPDGHFEMDGNSYKTLRPINKLIKMHHVDTWRRWAVQDENGTWITFHDLKYPSRKTKKPKNHPALNRYFSTPRPLKLDYKGKTFFATLQIDGKILFDGKLYNTPSGAGKVIRDNKATDGWYRWFVEKEDGTWVRLGQLEDKNQAA
ncbi:MAG: GIY-YIG nuclease family protein [Bacteriovoracaceae bacterium]|nr:GIY-YIG nuclease family protein [Bacteriovoracaceae bacterium]